MKLSEAHIDDLKKLLSFITDDEILSLAQTVTNRNLDLTGKDECIKAIFSFSQSTEELLKRKKISRKALFQYLASEEIVFDPSSEKHVLIDIVVKYWEQKSTKVTTKMTALQAHPSTGDNNGQQQPQSSQSNTKTDESVEFSRQFARWFYTMLNDSNPRCSSNAANQLAPVHFYPDCKLRLLCHTSEHRTEELQGNDMVCQRLLALVQQELLLFNPNLETDGLSSEKSVHGLVVVHVCGTIHRGEDVLGVFEQKFGLVKDLSTADNNWKVKFTHMCIQAGGAAGGRPKLGGPMTQMIEGS